MTLIDVGPPSCPAAAGIHAADVAVSRLILWLRDRAAESEVFALERPMCVIFHFRLLWLGLLGLAQLPPHNNLSARDMQQLFSIIFEGGKQEQLADREPTVPDAQLYSI